MKVVITGADGFLGRHSRVRLRALTDYEVVPVARSAFADDRLLGEALEGADAVLHIAGINRDAPEVVEAGNRQLAERLTAAVDAKGIVPTIVFANSIQAGNDSPYGRGKRQAAAVLAEWAERSGGAFVDVILPNVYGEGGRPRYNSFVATFCDALSRGEQPTVEVDRTVELIHAQDAAALLLDAVQSDRSNQLVGTGRTIGVGQTLALLNQLASTYSTGRIPDLHDPFAVKLFNTYRSYLYPSWYPCDLDVKADDRGRFVELVQSAGGGGQSSYSTTRPGITRGNHFHLRKIERFVVIEGRARISIRPMWGGEVTSFDVSGDQPALVDMPTLHTHNITNTGAGDLVTMFWTNEIFDPADPDTYPEPVA